MNYKSENQRVKAELSEFNATWEGRTDRIHSCRDDRGRLFLVRAGHSVETELATARKLCDMARDVPAVSVGPSGIGGQYNKDYDPLFKNHNKVGLVARIIGVIRKK